MRYRPCTLLAVGLLLGMLLLGASASACAGSRSATGNITDAELRFRWVTPAGFPGTVSLSRAPSGHLTGETLAFAPGDRPEVGEALPDGVLRVRLDEPVRVMLRVDNPGAAPLRFWVAPHLPQPHHAEASLMTQCLCTGETYEVPAGGSWTRVLEFGVRRRGAVTPVGVTHVIVLGEPPR